MDEFFKRIFKVINSMKVEMEIMDEKFDMMIQRHMQFMTLLIEFGADS